MGEVGALGARGAVGAADGRGPVGPVSAAESAESADAAESAGTADSAEDVGPVDDAGPADAVVPGAPARFTELADGVFGYVQPDGGWCLNNAGLLVAGGESVLIDTVATEARARRLRALALRLAPAAPRLLVNTHFHGDHTFGNFLFPEATVVAHAHAREDVLRAGLHLTGLWPEVRWGDLRVVPPSVTYRDRMTLHIGGADGFPVELLHPGPAHTTGDTVVWLPEQRVVFTGDLVMSRVTPFCVMGSVSGSLKALETLRSLGAETVVPGHGPVGGPELLDADEGYLRRLQRLATAGLATGLPPAHLAHDPAPGPYADLLDTERLLPNLHRAYAEARGAPPGAPLDIPALFHEMTEHHGGAPACYA
ncbi:MBL fold metallo-hydrolase [Streptomyces sp. NHF165]|uniref:MBL fold metallo-hydrolase n=1 Tax=Streptomyces sp. NHF165 TaxID=2175864 RepID=UPI00132E78BB|nr:MBL fold metallo-hydrolase [Streptomyces sp. NHF165]QHF97362.1 MBL fold metallo-hydrolase [Streptomyces sp. NHF165]